MPFLYQQFASSVDNQSLFSDPERLIKQGQTLKDDKSTTVVKIEIAGKAYILKRFNARTRGHSLKRALRKTRAKCCWEMSHLFKKVGISVAKPIVMFERRYGPFKGDSYFISEFIEGEELLEWLPSQKQDIISQVRAKIQKLFIIFHYNRLSHGDMKATNLLWSQGEVFLIDLDVARSHFWNFSFHRAHARDKRRFCRNGDFFKTMLNEDT